MKLYVDHKLDNSGKGYFLQRLKPELEKLGVEFTDFKSCDIVLGLNKYRKGVNKDKKRAIKDKKKRILRLDGIHLVKSRRNIWANRIVKQDADRSHAIIWQSEFCRKMWKGIMNVKAPKEYVIFNGANPNDYKNVKPAKSEYKNNVIISGKFFSGARRDNKGLRAFIRVAKEYNGEDTCFWVAGKTDLKSEASERLKFLGHLPELELKRYLKLADCMLYLANYDWCPNAIVECLVAGTPVICIADTAVEEIVKASGTTCNFEKLYRPKMIKKDIAPELSDSEVDDVCRVLFHYFMVKRKVKAPWLYISEIAKQYYQVFNEVQR